MVTYRTIENIAVSHADGRVTVHMDGQVFAFSPETARALADALNHQAGLVARQIEGRTATFVDVPVAASGAAVLRQAQDERVLGAADLVAERAATHGNFRATARVAQAIRGELADAPNWLNLRDVQREAAGMIATKLARATCGDGDAIDHWRDIAGYAQLVVDDLALRQAQGERVGVGGESAGEVVS